MTESLYDQNQKILERLMQQAKIKNLQQLSDLSGISELQLIRLQNGLFLKLPLEVLLKLSQTLKVSVNELINLFYPEFTSPSPETPSLETLKQEYQILKQQMIEQKQTLLEEFQRATLEILESWLIQWPTAVYLAKHNPHFPIKSLIMLVKPLEKLLHQWGIEAIASVGEEIPYNPQWHQLTEGNVQPGDLVKVRYIGYKKGDKVIHRVKVSPPKKERP